MASITKQANSRFWYLMYRDARGKQHCRSTKIEVAPQAGDARERAAKAGENRRLAVEMANRIEESERGNAVEAQLRKILSDVSERVNRRKLEFKITGSYLDEWLVRAKSSKSEGTFERYRTVVDAFKAALGSKVEAVLGDITPSDVQAFIAARLESGRNPSTVRTDCKILNGPFNLAMRQGLILTNPVAATDLPSAEKESRQPFSAEHVRLLLEACDRLAKSDGANAATWREWKTAIKLGYFTGQRLGDVVAMRLANCDFEKHAIKIRPQKTARKKRDLIIPLHPALEAHLLDLPVANKEGLLCPILAARKVSGKYGLSLQFHRIITQAGIEQQKIEARGDAGHVFNKFSFHSLRHSFVSELANAGIPGDVRQLLAGHSDPKSHAVYTHTMLETLAKAVSHLPAL